MRKLPLKLEKSLNARKEQNALRKLGVEKDLVDFSSNDYLGFATSLRIFEQAHQLLRDKNLLKNGSGGSRLLSGNYPLYELAEENIAAFHSSEAALIFNSGYDANLGFFGSVPRRGDVILYDELCHASIRDGINLSRAKAYKFRHNDLEDLKEKLDRHKKAFSGEFYIATEAIFSMDGDAPDLKSLAEVSSSRDAFLVLDEAHSTGVTGKAGKGPVEELKIQDKIFARIITFGKALGTHGAVVLGNQALKNFLINFARSFIYTTALPPHSVAGILSAYKYLENEALSEIEGLHKNISFFLSELKKHNLEELFIPSNSAIHCCIIPGNAEVKQLAERLKEKGFDVKPILSPTVPKGEERLRFCLHSYNTSEEIQTVLSLLSEEIRMLKKARNE